MKTQNSLKKTKLAILSAKANRTKVAILSADLNKADDNGWRQLLPAGSFTAVDGRPNDTKNKCWFLDKEIAKRFIDNTVAYAKKQNILIDYDHQTLHRNETGQKALAAGWIVDPKNNIEWREGKGIYVRAEWTPPAQAEIDNKQWGALSAIFPYNEDGHPLYLMMAGLTNDPGLREIETLAVLASELLTTNQPKEETQIMNELLRTLLIALGAISADETAELTEEQLNEIGQKAINNLESLKSAATAAVQVKETVDSNASNEEISQNTTDIVSAMGDDITEAEKEVLSEVALSRKVNMTKFLSNFMPSSLFNKTVQNQAVLSSENSEILTKQLIDEGRKKGQVLAAEVGYLTAIGKTQGTAALSAIISARSPLSAVLNRQTAGITPPPKGIGITALSAEQKEAARLMGKSEADYLKLIKEESK